MSATPPQLRAERPPAARGALAAVGSVALVTALAVPLRDITPAPALGVLYVLPPLVVSSYWGLRLGLLTSLLGAAAFDFFYLPPVGSFTLATHHEWIALIAFVVSAAAVSFVSDLARTRAVEADLRRREADLAAVMAQQLLGAARLEDALGPAARRVAAALGASSASIELRACAAPERHVAFPLREQGAQIGTLILPASVSGDTRERVETRVVPALQSVLAVALHREELQAEAVETASLRRSDEMKTAVLRSVSHDLRTPVTAMLTAAEALDAAHPDSVREIRELLLESGTRLAGLIDKLLDLSLLEAGTARPRAEWCSLDDVIAAASDHAGGTIRVTLDESVPLLLADSAQLERAFANLLENAVRHSAGKPVSVLARVVGDRVRVRVVDQGPGIPPGEQERIFLPFYRAGGRPSAQGAGSGLGLAIAKGFIEAGGGRIAVESLPGQGTTFVVDLPLPDRAAVPR